MIQILILCSTFLGAMVQPRKQKILDFSALQNIKNNLAPELVAEIENKASELHLYLLVKVIPSAIFMSEKTEQIIKELHVRRPLVTLLGKTDKQCPEIKAETLKKNPLLPGNALKIDLQKKWLQEHENLFSSTVVAECDTDWCKKEIALRSSDGMRIKKYTIIDQGVTGKIKVCNNLQTKLPIQALVFSPNAQFIAAKIKAESQEEVVLWDTESPYYYLRLEDLKYSKDYVTDEYIVRSHADQSAYLSYFDGNKIYKIPYLYLKGTCNSNLKITHFLYFYLLSWIDKAKSQSDMVNPTIQIEVSKSLLALKNSDLMKDFEPEIADSIRAYLQQRAAELGCTL